MKNLKDFTKEKLEKAKKRIKEFNNRDATNIVRYWAGPRWSLFMPLVIGAGEVMGPVVSDNANITPKNYDANQIEISADYSRPQKKENTKFPVYHGNDKAIREENIYKMKGGNE